MEYIKVIRGTPKHLSKTGRLDKLTYLMINLPFICNYRCAKCFNLKENIPIDYSKNITPTQILKLIEEAHSTGIKVIVFGGEGEPTLDSNIRKYITKINSLGMITILYSNGSTLSKEVINFYKTHNVSIVISFDSLNPVTYCQLTGTGQLNKVLENIKNTINIFKDTIEYKENLKILRVAINTTITSKNKNEVLEIKKYMQENYKDDVYFICNPVFKSGNADFNWKKIGYNQDYTKEVKTIKSISETGGPLTLGNDGICGYSRWGIAINPAGEYMTCSYTLKTSGFLGNIKKMDLITAFNNKHKIEEKYKDKNQPCLIRSSGFEKYIKYLEKGSRI